MKKGKGRTLEKDSKNEKKILETKYQKQQSRNNETV